MGAVPSQHRLRFVDPNLYPDPRPTRTTHKPGRSVIHGRSLSRKPSPRFSR